MHLAEWIDGRKKQCRTIQKKRREAEAENIMKVEEYIHIKK